MSYHWRKILLSLTAAVFIFASCKKNMSSDDPLNTAYYPSVVISSNNMVVYALDPGTGKKNWEFSMPRDTGSVPTPFKPSPLVYGNRVYVASVGGDTLYKLDSRTGKLITKMTIKDHTPVSYPGHFFTIVGTPIAEGKLIYLPTTNDTLYAIDTGTGNVQWKFGEIGITGSFVSSPVIYKNNIFFASTSGHIYCVDKLNGPDAITGFPKWDYPGPGNPVTTPFISSPSISYPYLYIGGAIDSNMYCIYVDPPVPPTPPDPIWGVAKWQFKAKGNINSSPTAYGGRVFFGCGDFNLYCVDSQSGGKIWAYKTNSQITSSPIISGQVVYVGSYDYNLYAINIVNGYKKWNFATKGLIKSSPLPYAGRVYVASYDGYIYAVDSGFGVMAPNFPPYKINGNIECSPAVEDYSGKQYNSGISGFNTATNIN